MASGCSMLEDLEREGTEPTKTAESARFAMEFEPAGGQELPKAMEVLISAQVVEGGERARLTMDSAAFPGGVEGPDLEFIFVKDGPVYFHPIAKEDTLPEGKSWYQLDESQLSEIIPGFDRYIGFFTDGRMMETRTLAEEQQTGAEDVRGVNTTVYTLSADIQEMASATGLSAAEVEEMQKLVGEEAEVTFWLDHDGFTRRMEMPLSLSLKGVNYFATAEIEMYDIDGTIEVDLPPPSKVIEP